MEAQGPVHYALLAQGDRVFAEYGAGREWAAAEFLARVPPLHRKYSHTEDDRVTCYLMDGPWTYCIVASERLGKSMAFASLEVMRDEFKQLLAVRGSLESLAAGIAPIMESVVSAYGYYDSTPIVESPQSDDNIPLMFKKTDARLERRDSSSSSSCVPLSRAKSVKPKADGGGNGSRGKMVVLDGITLDRPFELTSRTGRKVVAPSQGSLNSWFWKRGIKLVIIGNLILCVMLLSIWLGVCGGLRCT